MGFRRGVFALVLVLWQGSSTAPVEAFTNDRDGVEIITATQALFGEQPVDLVQARALAERYEVLCDRALDPAVRRWCLHQLMNNAYAYYWVYTKPSLLLAEKSEDLAGIDTPFLEHIHHYVQAYLNAVESDNSALGDSVAIVSEPAAWRLMAPTDFVQKHAYINALIDFELASRRVRDGRYRGHRSMARALDKMEDFIEWRFARAGYGKMEDPQENLFSQTFVRAYIGRTLETVRSAKMDGDEAEVQKLAAQMQVYKGRIRAAIRMGARMSGQRPDDFASTTGAKRYLTPVGDWAREWTDGKQAIPRLAVAASYYEGWRRLTRPLTGTEEQKSAYLDTVCAYFARAGTAARMRSHKLDVLLAAAGKLSKGEERRDKKCLFSQIATAYELASEDDEVRQAMLNYTDFVWSNAAGLPVERRTAYAEVISALAPDIAAELEIQVPEQELITDEVYTHELDEVQ